MGVLRAAGVLTCLQRKEIVTGEYEPTDEECEWPSDDEDEDEEGDEGSKPKPVTSDEEEAVETKGLHNLSLIYMKADVLAIVTQSAIMQPACATVALSKFLKLRLLLKKITTVYF